MRASSLIQQQAGFDKTISFTPHRGGRLASPRSSMITRRTSAIALGLSAVAVASHLYLRSRKAKQQDNNDSVLSPASPRTGGSASAPGASPRHLRSREPCRNAAAACDSEDADTEMKQTAASRIAATQMRNEVPIFIVPPQSSASGAFSVGVDVERDTVVEVRKAALAAGTRLGVLKEDSAIDLLHVGQPLDPSHTFSSYNIQKDATLHCIYAKEEPVYVKNALYVKSLDGKTSTLSVDRSDRIASVKQKIEAVRSIPVDRQKLIFAGKMLKDERTLDGYNISIPGSTVHLVEQERTT